ncbi:hypothetical protein OIU74_015614 [Salix koriyanagi]|uniref:Uncharacterized protein n=1 Tax=Salix koriyanagi TaxID=2511006 RepID=A0A9Q0PMH7_9ROSI|nr:hypothetical protein OIU74_015614 [Salix koriyanagi]
MVPPSIGTLCFFHVYTITSMFESRAWTIKN